MSAEEDAPRRKGYGGQPTEILDAVTRPHHVAATSELPQHDAPVRLVVGPTEHVDGPTRMLNAAEIEPEAMAGKRGAVSDYTRVVQASAEIRKVAEAMEVEGRPRVAQLLGGIASALSNGPVTSPLEASLCRFTKELWLIDSGIGGEFGPPELSRLFVEIAMMVAVGTAPDDAAVLRIAERSETKAAGYRQLQRQAQGRRDVTAAALWDARADELEAQARELRKQVR